jgi:hypothetical protein
VIILRRMRGAGKVVLMVKGRGVYGVWWGTLRERGHWGDPGVDGMIVI